MGLHENRGLLLRARVLDFKYYSLTRRIANIHTAIMASGEVGGRDMDIIHERAAGMDISKRDVKVAVRKPGKRRSS